MDFWLVAYLVRIPVTVEDDHSVCCLQVETKTTSTCAEQENEEWRIWLVEQLKKMTSVVGLCCTVKTQIPPTLPPADNKEDRDEQTHTATKAMVKELPKSCLGASTEK